MLALEIHPLYITFVLHVYTRAKLLYNKLVVYYGCSKIINEYFFSDFLYLRPIVLNKKKIYIFRVDNIHVSLRQF